MNKKRRLLLLALLAVVLYLTLRNQPDSATKQTDNQAAAFDAEIAILSVNDMHANIDMFP